MFVLMISSGIFVSRSSLCHVSDLLVMGAALVLESCVLHDWLYSQGIGPVGITGMSMGGHVSEVCMCTCDLLSFL